MLGLRYVEEEIDTWLRTDELGRSLDAAGKMLPLPDLLLSVLAQGVDTEVYSTDKHFQKVPGLRLYRPVLQPQEGAKNHKVVPTRDSSG